MGIPHAVTGSQPGPVTLELFISDEIVLLPLAMW